MKNVIALFVVTIGIALAASASEKDNVREVQQKLRDSGFYFGQVDGAFSTELAAALSRYQIRNGLPITGQLDADTSKALGVKPAVTTSSPNDQARTSETWERLRKSDKQFPGKTVWRAVSPSANETRTTTGMPPRSAPAVTAPGTQSAESPPQESPTPGAQVSSENPKPASAPPATVSDTGSSAPEFGTERLRDYVGAFVLAGLDPKVGSEAAFFADRVHYYDSGMMDREKIREDLTRYDARWPDRRFWLAGDITVEPQSDNRVRVTFPLKYELRNGAKHSSGKIDKTLVLELVGDDLQIVTVNERKAE